MPRGRQPRQYREEDIEVFIQEVEDVVVPTNKPVSIALSKQYFAFAKKAKHKLEHCPICLDELCCPNCFTLLPCGHYLCAPCYVRLTVKRCPVCRAE
jgi:hypothetical protein